MTTEEELLDAARRVVDDYEIPALVGQITAEAAGHPCAPTIAAGLARVGRIHQDVLAAAESGSDEIDAVTWQLMRWLTEELRALHNQLRGQK